MDMARAFMRGGPFGEVAERARTGITTLLTTTFKEPVVGDDTPAVLGAYRTALDTVLAAPTPEDTLKAVVAAAMMGAAVHRVLKKKTASAPSTEDADHRTNIMATTLLANAAAGDGTSKALATIEGQLNSGQASNILRKTMARVSAVLFDIRDKLEDGAPLSPKIATALAMALKAAVLSKKSVKSWEFWAEVAVAVATAWASDQWASALSGRAVLATDTYGMDDERWTIMRLWEVFAGVLGTPEPPADNEIDADEKKKAASAIDAQSTVTIVGDALEPGVETLLDKAKKEGAKVQPIKYQAPGKPTGAGGSPNIYATALKVGAGLLGVPGAEKFFV